jgi:hypothetical protein
MKHRSLLPHLLGRHWLPLVLTAFATLSAAGHARAGLIVSVESVTANAGSIGDALDVTLTNTGTSAVTVSGFTFGVSVATTNVTFTEANISTAVPYIFQGESLFGPVISTSTGQSLLASDLFVTIGSGASVGAGAEVGLGHLLFDVSALAPSGPVIVSLVTDPTTTLTDPSGNNIIIDSLKNGTITVVSSTVIPEPSTMVLAFSGIPAFAWFVWLRIRRSGKPDTEFH